MKNKNYSTSFKILALISAIGICACTAQQPQRIENNIGKVQSVQAGQKGNNSNPVPQTDNKTQAAQYYLQGVKYYGDNEYEKAKDSWTKAYQLDPENEDVSIALKRIDQVLLMQKEQNPHQDNTAADSKAQAAQYYLEGVRYYGNAEYQKAKDAWTKAQQLDPENEEVRLGLKRIEQLLAE